MAGFTKLFSSIVTSSIWSEDDKTRILWITMLALAGEDGVVEAAVPGLAKVAGMSIEDCERSLDRLMAPDPYSRTPDHDGRRIEPCRGGWVVLNHGEYRDRRGKQLSDDPKAEYSRRWMREKRAEKSTSSQHESTSSQHCSTSFNNVQHGVNKTQPSVSVSVSESSCKGDARGSKGRPETGIPAKLATERFERAWESWVLYCDESGRPLRQTQADMLLKGLIQNGPDKAASMIETSIARGWKSIQEALPPIGQTVERPKEQAVKLTKDSDPALWDYARQYWNAKRSNADRDTFAAINRKVRDGFGEQWVAAVKAAAADLERKERGYIQT